MVKQSVLTELLSTSSFLISSATFALLLLMYVCRVLREHRQRERESKTRHALRQERVRKLEQLQVVCFALHEAKVLPENADQRSGHPPYMRHWSGADTPTDISSPLSTPGSTSSESTPTFLRKAKFLDTQRDDEEARAIGSHAQLLVERAAAADDKPALAACYRSLLTRTHRAVRSEEHQPQPTPPETTDVSCALGPVGAACSSGASSGVARK